MGTKWLQLMSTSGHAFVWAEAACWTLRKAHKPYVLMLHGGNLPKFASAQPDRVKKLLASAAAVSTPSRYLLEQHAALSQKYFADPQCD